MINPRIAAIPPSASLAVTSRAKALAASGRKIFSFAAGEPDFDTPEHIKQAAAQALAKGETKYTPESGLLTLRQAIADKLKSENGLEYTPEQICVSNGAKQSIFNIIMTICSEGDEVLIPSPFWLSYPEMCRVAGARPVLVPCREDRGFRPDIAELERATTSRTKAIIVNSPSNPLGVVYTEEDLRAIADLACRRNLLIVSDEIYEKILYDGATHFSIGRVSREVFDRTITVNGFSKAYSMTGWRLGYAAARADIMKAACALQGHSTSGPNTFAQHGAIAALKGDQSCVAAMVKAFAERRDYLHQRLSAIPGVLCVKPTGAFYMFANISRFGLGSVAFAAQLLEKEGVAVVPGESFGADTHIRFSYACSLDNIRNGMDHLERFIAGLK